MSERNYYVLCDDNCRFPGMTAEQIYAAIAQAVEGGTVGDIDTGFVTKLKEQNANKPIKMWIGTSAQFNALTETDDNTMYILTDDDMPDALEETISTVQKIISGETTAGKATADGDGNNFTGTYVKKNTLNNNNIKSKNVEITVSQSGSSYRGQGIVEPDEGEIITGVNVVGIYSADFTETITDGKANVLSYTGHNVKIEYIGTQNKNVTVALTVFTIKA